MRHYLQQHSVDVVLTRDGDYTPGNASPDYDLQARCDIANRAGADVFVSVHADAALDPSAHGTTTYYYDGSAEGKKLAEMLLAAVVSGTGLAASLPPQLVVLPDNFTPNLDGRGTKLSHFYVLKFTAMPASLVEVAFISNPQEEAMLNDPAFQDAAGLAIAKGICDYLGVPWMADVNVPDWARDAVMWAVSRGLINSQAGSEDFYRFITILYRYDKLRGGC